MSIHKSVQYMLVCDECVHGLIDYGDIAARNQRDFERQARRIGWHRVDGKWLCPKCYRAPFFRPNARKQRAEEE